MATHAHKKLVRRFTEVAWNDGNLDAIDEFVADEFIGYDPSLPEPMHGPAGVREYVEMYRSAFPDIHITIEDMIAGDDQVAVRWTGAGTHEGELMGIDPTETAVEVMGLSFKRIADGTFVEEWRVLDTLGMLHEIGVLPSA
jgi:steroid delta-isomerase-like uncharacterized protein